MPSTLNLLLQLVILGVLLYGVLMVKRGRLNSHGMIVFTAVGLNTLSILVVMLPSAFRILGGVSLGTFTMIVVVHSLLGLVVLVLGTYIIFKWRFRPPGPTCSSLRGLMRVLAALWILSVGLGAVVYYNLL